MKPPLLSGFANANVPLDPNNAGPKLLRGIAALIAALIVTNLFLPQDTAEQSLTLTVIIGFAVFAGMQFISNRDLQTPEPIGKVRSHASFLVATIVAVIVFGQLSGQSQLIPATLIAGWFAYTIWRRPAVAAFSAMSAAAVAGGPLILIAAPATVMLARRDMRLRIGERRSIQRTVKTLGLALLVFLITLLFADAAIGDGRSGTTGAEAAGDGSRSPLQRFTDWITRNDEASSTPGRFVRVPEDAAAPPDDPTRWWLLALVLAGLLLAGFAYWYWRRRGSTGGPGGPTVAAPLARLEMLGAAVGRPRLQHEGAISYAQELGAFTGDDRLAGTGTLVSGQVYASETAHAASVEAGLLALEQAPPQAPPQPTRRERIAAAARPVSIRGLALGAVALAGIIAVAFVASTNSQALREPHRTNELSARMPSNTPAQWWEVLALDDDEVTEWQACRGWGEADGGDTRTVSALSGVAHDDSRLGATLSVAQSGNDRSPQYASWSVGSNDSSSSWWDGDLSEPPDPQRQGDWYTLDGYNDVPHRLFESVEEMLVQLGVREPARSEHIDSFGWPFTRFESRPLRYSDDQPVSDQVLPAGLDGSFETMWVVDVWTDTQNRPVRVRIMGDEPERYWSEWRRLPEAQAVRLASPLCPTAADPNTAEWAGYESWEPSRTVEQQIDFDADGNPYDVYYWDEPFDEVTAEAAGDLAGPIAELGIGDLFTLVQDDPVAPIKVATTWSAGASIQALSRADGWPTGALVTADNAGSIVEWVDEAEAEIYSTFVTLTTADNYPSLTSDELDPWLEPLWNGELLTTIYFADQRTTPVTVLTLSDATRVVSGRDVRGQVVAVLIWDEGSAWRQLGLEGTPPALVLERETQLHDCLAGTRPIGSDGRCSHE